MPLDRLRPRPWLYQRINFERCPVPFLHPRDGFAFHAQHGGGRILLACRSRCAFDSAELFLLLPAPVVRFLGRELAGMVCSGPGHPRAVWRTSACDVYFRSELALLATFALGRTNQAINRDGTRCRDIKTDGER